MADRRIDKVIIDAGIAQDTTGVLDVAETAHLYEFAFYVRFENGANAGVVKIETASSSTFTGTWAVLATVTYAANNAEQYVAVAGSLRAVRARISTAIGGGGDVIVRAIANR